MIKINKGKKRLPAIGMRILKSAIAVFICFMVYSVWRLNGIMFYSMLAALWCIQPFIENTMAKAMQRTIGTITGAIIGLIVLLLDINIVEKAFPGTLVYSLLVSAGIIIVLYTTVLIRKPDASYFSCVVFLSIVVNHIGDANPYIFVMNRVLDTLIGIVIGMLVNMFRLPHTKRKDILFISGMDDTLFFNDEKLSPYTLVELNRMIKDGANFTVSTKRTPASLIEPLRGIKLKLPVIAMDGSVMYDINSHEYIKCYVISHETMKELRAFLDRYNINYFMNLLLDNILVIQYSSLQNDAEKDIYNKLHESPYRNYTTYELAEQSKCIYFMLINKTELIEQIYSELITQPFISALRLVTYESTDYPGFSYIKIYNKNATRENMIAYLKQETGLEKTVTFGSIPGMYDVVIEDYDSNKVVKTLKRMYEQIRI